MDRRSFLTYGAAATAAGLLSARGEASSNLANRYRDAIIIDSQSTTYEPYDGDDEIHLTARGAAELNASGLTAISTTVGEVGNGLNNFDRTIKYISETDAAIAANPNHFLKATTVADILRAKREQKLAVIYNTQDTAMVGVDLDRLGILKGLGVRVVQLTYNLRNLSGDGCLEPGNGGLSKLGRATIERIEKEKLLLDLSHSGQRTVAEALAAAKRPPTISHTGCRALNDNPRNQWDAELKACADKGGVVGIYWMPFLASNSKATGADLVRHMDHARQICGEDHISIGTDGMLYKTVIDDKARAEQKKFYDDRAGKGIAAPGEGADVFNVVAEWDDYMRFQRLIEGLESTRWSSTAIEKALGGNLMRLYREVWGS